MTSGWGGLPRRRIDQLYHPPAVGAAPGQASPNVVARIVIIYGTNQGVFLYQGAPSGTNPPVLSLTGPATTADPYGNPVTPDGYTVYEPGGVQAIFVGLMAGNVPVIEVGTAGSSLVSINPLVNTPFNVTSVISGVLEAAIELTTTDSTQVIPGLLGSLLLGTGDTTKMSTVLTSPLGAQPPLDGTTILTGADNGTGSVDGTGSSAFPPFYAALQTGLIPIGYRGDGGSGSWASGGSGSAMPTAWNTGQNEEPIPQQTNGYPHMFHVLSWKCNPINLLAGDYDTNIAEWGASCQEHFNQYGNGSLYVSWYHEADNNALTNPTPAQYAAAMEYIQPKFKAACIAYNESVGNPDGLTVPFGQIMTGGSGHTAEQWLVTDGWLVCTANGNSYDPDFVTFDKYLSDGQDPATYTPETAIGSFLALAQSLCPDAMVGITETNTAVGTGQTYDNGQTPCDPVAYNTDAVSWFNAMFALVQTYAAASKSPYPTLCMTWWSATDTSSNMIWDNDGTDPPYTDDWDDVVTALQAIVAQTGYQPGGASAGAALVLEAQNDGGTDVPVLTFGTIATPDDQTETFFPVLTISPYALLLYSGQSGQTTKTATSGTGTWTGLPATVKAEAWAAGGGGGTAANFGATSAGGGEYAQEPALATSGSVTYSVGAAGSGGVPGGEVSTDGGNTTITGSAVTVTANGGVKGTSTDTPGAGGSGSTNTIHYDGGAGAGTVGGGPNGAGGGSSAGTSGPGNNGTEGLAHSAGSGGAAVTGGGAGGRSGNNGQHGDAPGGGGGGSSAGNNGGNGAQGQVRITYTTGAPGILASFASASGTDQFGTTYPAGMVVPVGVTVEPGTTTPETWHTISLDSGWTAGNPVPQYRMTVDGNLQLAGKATHSAITSETAVNSSDPIPSAYRPVSDKKIYQGNRAGSLTGASIDTTGIVYAEPNGVSGTIVDLTGIVDLL